jgi:hypothetical protein
MRAFGDQALHHGHTERAGPTGYDNVTILQCRHPIDLFRGPSSYNGAACMPSKARGLLQGDRGATPLKHDGLSLVRGAAFDDVAVVPA